MNTKICSKCKIEKSVEQFYKDSTRTNGPSRCKDCCREHVGYTKRKTDIERFWDQIDIICQMPCWYWKCRKNRDGYGMIRTGKRRIGAHRFAYEYFNNTRIPNGLLVRHSCNNPACVNPSHLSIGTSKDNSCDMMYSGKTKLRQDDILDIRTFYINGITIQKIADKYNVQRVTIRNIIRGRTWTNIK